MATATTTRRKTRKKKTKWVPTAAQKAKMQAEKGDALTRLAEGIANLQSSDDWKRVLKWQATGWRYSFNNNFLIWMQMPHATKVMSKSAWAKVGRHIKSGLPTLESGYKGLRIMVPMKFKTTDDKGEESYRLGGFKMGSTFDLSMTEGEPPPPSCRSKLKGDDPGIVDALVAVCEKTFGIPVVYKTGDEMAAMGSSSALGYWHPREKYIAIKSGQTGACTAHVFCHELAHALHGHGKPGDKRSYDLGELEADSTAFVVADHFGLDTSGFSFGYIASYRGALTADSLKSSGGAIARVAKQIIEAIESAKTQEEKNA